MPNSLLLSCLVACLVSQLGSPAFAMREKAHAALGNLLPLSLSRLEQASQMDDMETATRAGQLVRWHYQDTAKVKAAKALPKDYPYLPWLDRLPEDYPGRWNVIYYWKRLANTQGGNNNAPYWDDYRLATRLFIEEMYADPTTAGKVQGLLDSMAQSEIQWIRQHGNEYSPPVQLP